MAEPLPVWISELLHGVEPALRPYPILEPTMGMCQEREKDFCCVKSLKVWERLLLLQNLGCLESDRELQSGGNETRTPVSKRHTSRDGPWERNQREVIFT